MITVMDELAIDAIANDESKWRSFISQMTARGCAFQFDTEKLTPTQRASVMRDIFISLEKREMN